MTAERLVAALEQGRTAWLAPPIAVALAVGPGLAWNVPDERGIALAEAWAGVFLIAAFAFVAARRRRPSAIETTAIVVAAAAFVGDVTLLPSQGLRDLDLYLRAGQSWLDGQPVYIDHVLTAIPADRSMYPYLYPPVTLPFVGALALLPPLVVHIAWPLASAALALLALRSFGLPWRWAILALGWRPFAEGLFVGNVAVPLLAAFALAPRAGALLALPGLFKVYLGIPAAWLLRERRWGDVGLATAIVAGLAIGTLPLIGFDAWQAWLTGIRLWSASLPALGGYASGVAIELWLGLPIALAIAAVGVLLALRAAGTEGLWRLGVASPIASPSVFSHGFLTALPAILQLRPVVLWLALAATAATPGPVFWVAPALVITSWFVTALRRAPNAATARS